MASKCSLQNILSDVIAVYNIEQSASLPPSIYSSMFNTTTSLLLDKLVKIYPSEQWAVDCIDPFLSQVLIPVTDGFIQLPTNYRNLLGDPMVSAKPDGSGECSDLPITATEFKTTIQKAKCKLNPLIIVPEAEFALRTRSTYDFPTITDPIGYYIGKKQIKVCPYDISKVLVTYAKNENIYRLGYVMQPDDTYIADEATTIESQWGATAYTPIFKAMCALYAAYSRDADLRDWSRILNTEGIL